MKYVPRRASCAKNGIWDAIDKQSEELDPKVRKTMTDDIQKKVVQEYPVSFLFSVLLQQFTDPKVQNWFYSIGGEYKFSDAFTFRAGVARDDSPVSRPYRTPRLPDQDRMWYSLGLTWALSEHFEINASYVKIDIVDTPEVDLTTSTRARLVGEFDGGADLYGVSMQYRF